MNASGLIFAIMFPPVSALAVAILVRAAGLPRPMFRCGETWVLTSCGGVVGNLINPHSHWSPVAVWAANGAVGVWILWRNAPPRRRDPAAKSMGAKSLAVLAGLVRRVREAEGMAKTEGSA